ncbi:ribosomal RNA processing protein 1 homolog B isoform X1 [Sorex araneus]|uniref:ribosomal RNA processing protein 1 homolog B isoform X1 n=1 Tax=Sorex araneus TaxID=42254 RepID=UPI002433B8FD|nr:ribosomal RNA processing protein 1 homolog B isoform X1 [Sorex araneus]
MGPAMQPAELQFAQRLASHEKGIRDRAARKLRQYISAKTQRETGGFTQEELLRIWKGLFYCMWVQDEPLLQEELAVTMSQLVHVVNNSEAQHLLIRTFWQTLNREWKGVDRLRLDKYHMLIRLTLRQSFEVLKRNSWEESRIRPLLDILMKEVLHPESRCPGGVRAHLIAVYLEELSKVGGSELLADQNLKFIDPFCKIAAKTKDHTLVQTIARGVFEAIAHRSPLALEASAEDHSARAGGGPRSGEELAACEGPPAAAAGKGLPQPNGAAEDRDGDGVLEAAGPPLQFDYKAVADRLLEMTSRKNTPPFNRKRLCRLAKKFRDLCEGGVAPPSLAEDRPADGDDPGLCEGQQMDRGEKQGSGDARAGVPPSAQEELGRDLPRRKRRKRRRRNLQPEAPVPAPPQSGAGETSGEELPPHHGAEEPSTGPGGAQKRRGGEPPPIHVKRKRLRKKGLRAVGEHSGTPEDAAEGAQVPRRKRRLGALPASGLDPSTLPQPCPAGSSPGNSEAHGPPPQGDSVTQRPPPQGDSVTQRPPAQGDGVTQRTPAQGGSVTQRPPPQGNSSTQRPLPQGDSDAQRSPLQSGKMKRKKKGEPGPLGLYSPSCPRPASLAKRKRVTPTLDAWSPVASPRQQGPVVLSLGGSGALGPPRKKQLRTEKDFVRFSAPVLPKPLFCRKAKSSAAPCAPRPPVQPSKTPPGTKKVTFGLSRNMTAEFKKTDKSILVSPMGPSRVAFDPKQRPLHGVLKSPASSPASSPLTTKKLLLSTPQRRPTAMDFF